MTKNGSQEALPEGWRLAGPAEIAADEPYALAIGPFGSNLKVSDYRDEGVPLVFVRNIRSGEYGNDATRYVSSEKAEELRAHRIDAGDVLITKMGAPPGDADVYPRGRPSGIITADCIKWRVGPDATGSFVRHMTNAPQMAAQIQAITSGVAQQKVSLKRFKSLRYPLPPLSEQQRIVDAIEALFSDLDAGEAALRDAKARLVRYRQSVLNAAVTGALTADWRAAHPDAEPAEVLLARLSTERRDAWEADTLAKYAAKGTTPPKNWKARYTSATVLETDDLPSLPDSWTWTTLEQITSGARLVQYGILKPGPNTDGGIPYVKVMNMRGDRIDVNGLRKTTPEIAASYERASLQKGDLLLSIRGTYGRVAVVPDSLDGGNITQDSVRIAPSEGVERDYLARHLRALTTQNFFESVAKGVAVKGVNVGDVRLTPIALPPTAEQAVIVEEVERRLSVADAVAADVEAQLARSKRLRRSILQRAFEGRLVPQSASVASGNLERPISALASHTDGTQTTLNLT